MTKRATIAMKTPAELTRGILRKAFWEMVRAPHEPPEPVRIHPNSELADLMMEENPRIDRGNLYLQFTDSPEQYQNQFIL